MNFKVKFFFLLALFISFIHSSHATNVIRGPYLQMASDSQITVRWRTNTPTDSVVRFGYSPDNLSQSVRVDGQRWNHEVTLYQLSASQQYYYSVGNSNRVLAGGSYDYRFTTSPPEGTAKPTRIWIIGDSGTANNNARSVYNAYLNLDGSDKTDLWLMLGDNAYGSGKDDEYQRAVFDMYPELLRRTPLWSTLGNHDGYTADSSSQSGPYYDIFTLPRYAEAGGLSSNTEAYYSFNYGNIHFICLDSYETNRSTDGAMLKWLENDLRANQLPWIIAFWHHPPYTKGSHDSDRESSLIDMRRNALPILERYGVDMVFSGHSHSYERSYLIDGHYEKSYHFNNSHIVNGGDGRVNGNGAYEKTAYSANSGTVYTVAGASGKISGGALNHPVMFRSLNQLGSVVLDVNHNEIKFRHLRANGQISDYFTLRKGSGGGGDTTPPTLVNAYAKSATRLEADFSENLDGFSASNKENYSLSDGIQVLSVSVQGSKVFLDVQPIQPNKLYTLYVNNVKDTAGNAMGWTQYQFDYKGNSSNRTIRFQQGALPSQDYRGAIDSSLSSGNPDRNYGQYHELLADGSDFGDGEWASVIRWDVSAIPASAQVISANVELDIFNDSDGQYKLYASNAYWQENSVTWNSLSPYSQRGTEVGTIKSRSYGMTTIPLNARGVEVVQNWVQGNNNGLMLLHDNNEDGLDMLSSQFDRLSSRPRLTVVYSVDSKVSQKPKANFSFIKQGLSVAFEDKSTDLNDDIKQRHWNFGDGTVSEADNPAHNFAGPGTYSVELKTTDAESLSDSMIKNIHVREATEPMTVDLQHGTNNYFGAQDTYVASGREQRNYGAESSIQADGDDGTKDNLIALLQWDTSALPKGATVTKAELIVDVLDRSSGKYNIWQQSTPWNETSATWHNTQPTQNRGQFLASFYPDDRGESTIPLNASGIRMVQSWMDGAKNYGISIESDGTTNGVDLRSKESDQVQQRPVLRITYQ